MKIVKTGTIDEIRDLKTEITRDPDHPEYSSIRHDIESDTMLPHPQDSSPGYGGHFITFEGGEGSGKTTLINEVADRLRNKGIDVMVTREPGGVEAAEDIRNFITDDRHDGMEPRTEALMYAAARQEHLSKKVVPALKEGKTVLCDRYIDSSIVYRGMIGGAGAKEVYEMNRFATNGLMPEATIYLDLDPQIGLSRIASDSSREVNRIDRKDLSFHQQVREGYLRLSNDYFYGRHFRKIDASRNPNEVLRDAMKIVDSVFTEKDIRRPLYRPSAYNSDAITGASLERYFKGEPRTDAILMVSNDGRHFCIAEHDSALDGTPHPAYSISDYSIGYDGLPHITDAFRADSLEGFEKEHAFDKALSGSLEIHDCSDGSKSIRYDISARGRKTGTRWKGSGIMERSRYESLLSSRVLIAQGSYIPGEQMTLMMQMYSDLQRQYSDIQGSKSRMKNKKDDYEMDI